MKLKYILRIIYHFIRGVIHPENVNHAIRVGRALCDSGVLETSVAKIKTYPGGEEFFARKNLFFNHGLSYFEKFPAGSLGRSYYEHLIKYNLDPNAFPKIEVRNDSDYIEHVVRHAHDVLHVVTGFDVSISGELGLQAFKAKQMNWPFAMIGIAGGSLVTLVREPKKIEQLVSDISHGYQLGAKAKPLIIVDWNEKWALPIET
ncbi:MAG: hypothetical protein H7061_08585, partial [Bdellovibrionaceae bacterium]|nr:hypothetical protein [Bdellovibrio sp.]